MTTLILAESIADVFLFETWTRATFAHEDVVRCHDLESLEKMDFDSVKRAVCIGFYFPDGQGVSAVERIRRRAKNIPIIYFSDVKDQGVLSSLLEVGATIATERPAHLREFAAGAVEA